MLDPDCQEMLLKLFPPHYPKTSNYHITMGTKVPGVIPNEILVIGVANDQVGIQALILCVDRQRFRPDGNPYHITWSYDPSKTALAELDLMPTEKQKPRTYRPMHSNKLVSMGRYSRIFVEPIEVRAQTIIPTPILENWRAVNK